MCRRILLLMMIAALTLSPAVAEIYTGSTVAGRLAALEAKTGGVLEESELILGGRVVEGEILGRTREKRVFAPENGVVSVIHAEEGKRIEGTALEILPENRYLIYCTVEKAYKESGNMLVHIGETLYIRCTINGTHRAVGIVTSIEGAEFQVEAIGGELYVGEAVYLYRESDFDTADRVGAGTVTVPPARQMQINGTMLQLCVEEGEYVERGELLFTWAEEDDLLLVSEVDGIVAEISAQEGDSLQKGQAVARIAPIEDIMIEISVDETEIGGIAVGDPATFVCAGDPEETLRSGCVSEIHGSGDGGSYVVRIRPDENLDFIGMSVEVDIE